MSDELGKYRWGAFSVTLYSNRIETRTGRGLFPSKREVIPLKNISGVDNKIGKLLEITTNDGKKHRMSLMPKQAEELRQRILELL